MENKKVPVEAAADDSLQLDRERKAQQRLLEIGGDSLGRPPWRPSTLPPSAVDLVQFAVSRSGSLSPEDLLESLTLMPAARAEIDGVEAGLLFSARSAGLTWAQIATAMGFRSPQACQQHFNRLSSRSVAEQ